MPFLIFLLLILRRYTFLEFMLLARIWKGAVVIKTMYHPGIYPDDVLRVIVRKTRNVTIAWQQACVSHRFIQFGKCCIYEFNSSLFSEHKVNYILF
jgi:hypothetical protein